MRSLVFSVALVTAVLGLAGSARAEEGDESRAGGYFEVGGLLALPTFEDELDRELDAVLGPVETDLESGGGLGLRLGYRLNAVLAAEAQFEYVGGSDIRVNGIEIAELSGWMLSGNLKLYGSTGRFQPYLLIGSGVLSAKIEDSVGAGISVEESDLALRVGGGVEVFLSSSTALVIEPTWVVGGGDLDDVEYVALHGGVVFHF